MGIVFSAWSISSFCASFFWLSRSLCCFIPDARSAVRTWTRFHTRASFFTLFSSFFLLFFLFGFCFLTLSSSSSFLFYPSSSPFRDSARPVNSFCFIINHPSDPADQSSALFSISDLSLFFSSSASCSQHISQWNRWKWDLSSWKNESSSGSNSSERGWNYISFFIDLFIPSFSLIFLPPLQSLSSLSSCFIPPLLIIWHLLISFRLRLLLQEERM